MSRLTEKVYKSINIDQILCGAKTNKSFSEILDDHNRILIENALHKLAEYENLGSVEDFKQLSHELEVYKRALKLAIIYAECGCDFRMPSEEYFLDQARKELEDE